MEYEVKGYIVLKFFKMDNVEINNTYKIIITDKYKVYINNSEYCLDGYKEEDKIKFWDEFIYYLSENNA